MRSPVIYRAAQDKNKRQYVSPASSQKALRLLLGVCSYQGTLGLPL